MTGTVSYILTWNNFKTPDELVLNEDFHKLVLASKLPRPSKFEEQSISSCKTLCKPLLSYELIKSDLARGLSAFDVAVMFDGPEKHYVTVIEKLSSHFVSAGRITPSDEVKATSQYRSFNTKMRANPVPNLSSHYEIHCRPELFQLFKYSCLCLPSLITMPTDFIVPEANLESDKGVFQSCLRSLQASHLTVLLVSSLYRDPKSIGPVFRLPEKGPDLLSYKKFSVWNFLKGGRPRRTAMMGKLETGYRKAVLKFEKPGVTSGSTTTSISRASSINSTPSPDPTLS